MAVRSADGQRDGANAVEIGRGVERERLSGLVRAMIWDFPEPEACLRGTEGLDRSIATIGIWEGV